MTKEAEDQKTETPLSQSAVEGRVMPFLFPKKAEIQTKRVQNIIRDIGHMMNREDCFMANEEFEKAIDHLRNAIERIKA